MNYIKDISHNITKNLDNINIVVEINKGTNAKTEVTADGKDFEIVRYLKKKYKYPFYYGFIPQTLADDKDPTDVLLIDEHNEQEHIHNNVTIIGVIPTIDCGEIDDKFIAINDGSKLTKKEIEKRVKQAYKFILNYKKPYHKDTTVDKIIRDKDELYKLLNIDIKRYNKKNKEIVNINIK